MTTATMSTTGLQRRRNVQHGSGEEVSLDQNGALEVSTPSLAPAATPFEDPQDNDDDRKDRHLTLMEELLLLGLKDSQVRAKRNCAPGHETHARNQ
jgi:hypothetical protein